MNIFERIQPKQGLENYCTDILVGILQKDTDLLRKFCIAVLEIPKELLPKDDSLNIEPQKSLFFINDDGKRQKNVIDILIQGTEFLCFLEMKVGSSQGKEQLINYHKSHLKEKVKYDFLRFCRKYNEPIYKSDECTFKKYGIKYQNSAQYFEKIRWYDIHDFLKLHCQDNPLINEFLEFLTLKNMDNKLFDKPLEYVENDVPNIYNLFKKFDLILSELKQVKNSYDSKIKNSFNQIEPKFRFDKSRFGFSLPFVDSQNKDKWQSNIFIGFQFEDENEKKDGIYKLIWLWSEKYDESDLKNYFFNDTTKSYRKIGSDVSGLQVIKKVNQIDTVKETIDWFVFELKNIQEIKIN